ncbi:MAG TPA: hypothetical protein VKG84_14085, partial [Candidatus Acidoferrales bacterium]|nr:hypothetical protein [Candidatus Acidoferrales bacterium]
PGDKKDVVELFSRENVTTRSHFRTQGIPDAVILDTVFSNLKFSVEGDDASGYRVRAQPIGAPPVVFLISHQPGGNRIVSVGDEYFMVGAEVLRRLAAGDTKSAKLWLDWAREGITLQTGDDPLGGSLFARFWTRGDDPDPAKMKLAALAALVDSSQIGEHLGELQAARAAAAEADQANMDLLIANAANKAKNWKLEKEAASRLLARYPRSDNALRLFSTACQHTEDWTAWEAAISARLTKLPDDEVALRSSARLAVWRGDFVASRAVFRKMIDSGRQNASDLNGYSWEALFTGTAVTDEDIAFAQQANKVTGGKNFGILHTLACLYAETGKGKEARELLLAAMQSAGLDQPNAGIWYGFGRIAEDYGVFAAARADYDRMEAEPGDESPDSTRRLALSRLRKMKNSGF